MSKLAQIYNFIKFPQNGKETAIAMRKFQVFTNFIIPSTVGVIDGTHVNITCPDTESIVEYYSRKQKYTLNIQGVVGYNLLFLDIATGDPRSLHDARILRRSTLYLKPESGDILSRSAKIVDGYCIKLLIVRDSDNAVHYTIFAKKEVMSLLTKTISSTISWMTNVENGIIDMVIFKNAETQKFYMSATICQQQHMSATICKNLLSNVITNSKQDLRD